MEKRLARTSSDVGSAGAFWLAALAGTAMATGVIAFWNVINDRAREHVDSATHDATRINQLLVRQDIDNRLSALDRLAQRWTAAMSFSSVSVIGNALRLRKFAVESQVPAAPGFT